MNWKKLTTLLAFAIIFYADVRAQKAEDLVELSLEELMNMEVTVASKQAERISDAAGVISVVSKEDIKRYGGLTLRDLLERVPSLNAVSGTIVEQYGIASRGDQIRPNSGHVLFLINGRPMREIVDGGRSSDILAAFPVNVIDHIEVIRGPGSVLYGTNAFSAVVNIITVKPTDNKAEVAIGAGNNSVLGTNAMAAVHEGDFGLVIGARYMDMGTDGRTFNTADFFTNEIYSIDPFDAVNISKSAFVEASYKGFTFTGTNFEYDAQSLYVGAESKEINYWQRTFGNLGYETEFGENWNSNFNLTYTLSKIDANESLSLESESNDWVAEWTNHFNLGTSVRLTAGGLINGIDGYTYESSFGQKISSIDRINAAVYSQVDYWALENLKLIGGFQINKVEGQDLDIVPRAGVIFYPMARLNLKALYSEAYRAASVNELDFSTTYASGNPDLSPEKIKTFDIGATFQGEKFQVGLNYYHSLMRNIINLDYSMDPISYRNMENMDFQGLEFETKIYFTKALMLNGSVLYQLNENEGGAKDITSVPQFSFKGGVSYDADYGVTLSLYNQYYGAQNKDVIMSQLNPYTSHYYLLNAYLNIDFVKLLQKESDKSINFFVQADNLLNKAIWERASDYVRPDGASFSLPSRLGRTIYAGVKIGFN